MVKDFIAFTGNSIILTGTHEDVLETQIFRSTIKAPRSTMISKAEGMHRVQANYNGRFLIDSYNSLQNPGTIELLDHTGKSMRTLLHPKTHLRIQKLHKQNYTALKPMMERH